MKSGCVAEVDWGRGVGGAGGKGCASLLSPSLCLLLLLLLLQEADCTGRDHGGYMPMTMFLAA